MRKALLFFCLLLTACNFTVGAPTSGDSPMPSVNVVSVPTLTNNTVAQGDIVIDQTQWVVMTKLMALDGCTTEATVVSFQAEPLIYTLEEGWQIKGDSDFDMNLGVLAACMQEKIGGFANQETINQALGMVYSYVAKAAGYDYDQYTLGVATYGNAIPQSMYDTLYLGVDVDLPVTIVTKPVQIQP